MTCSIHRAAYPSFTLDGFGRMWKRATGTAGRMAEKPSNGAALSRFWVYTRNRYAHTEPGFRM